MKRKVVKRLLTAAMAVVLAIGSLTGCGNGSVSTTETASEASTAADTAEGPASEGDTAADDTVAKEGRTIMWLSNLTSGIQYETAIAYLGSLTEALGYKFTVVYGDAFNDAAGNLTAVKNGMTSDVVGLLTSQDGGLLSIMEEYPELYVAGYNTDMTSVYGEGGENAACLENDHFLGTICDGFADGANMAELYFDNVVENGYKKIAVVNFPSYAYPNQGAADEKFKELVSEYNESAAEDDKIELVGETTTLEFAPLEDSWFLEEGRNDLDCIVAFCAGIQFVYPTMATAIANGTCAADTKMITGGFEVDESITAAIGDDQVMTMLAISPAENPAFGMVLLDNAISQNQYSDWKNDRIDSYPYVIDSTEDINNVLEKSLTGTGDVSLAQLSVEDVLALCVKNNPEATYADLNAALHDDATISVDALKNR